MSEAFTFRDGEAYCEDVPLAKLAAEFGTPLYVYSKAYIAGRCEGMKRAFMSYPALPCYAVKANSNLSILKEIFSHELGADVVSVGELERALKAGALPSRIVFSGVGKREDEIKRAIDAGIFALLVESTEECEMIRKVAGDRPVNIGLRINPNIDVKTNPHIATGLYDTKFGMTEADARRVIQESVKAPIRLIGLSCHLGSQIQELQPFQQAAKRIVALAEELRGQGHHLQFLDLGGGLGIRYQDENPPQVTDYARTLIDNVQSTGLRLLVEPGRYIVGNSGIILSKVVMVKRTAAKNFVVVDAAMNDLIRPSLYEAYHEIEAVRESHSTITADIVGPICETGDYLGKGRKIAAVKRGDLVMVRGAGAYGSSMASNYNTRPRAAEVLVDKTEYKIIRKRETLESLWANEL